VSIARNLAPPCHWPCAWAARLVAGILLAGAAGSPGAFAQEILTIFPAPASERQVLTLDTATDLAAFEPLIRDFQRIAPDVTIRYREFVTNALFERARDQCAAGRPEADLVITSSVDHLVVLSNAGCAMSHRSPETQGTPGWTRWRDEVFGFTFEPAVIVYNRALLRPEEVPRTRLDLIELMREQPARFSGRIGGYDIARSGIGYLFAAFDARNALIYGRLIEGFGRMRLVTRCCSADLIEALARGELFIGYNLLGSYAYSAQKAGAPIGIVIPHDYVLALSRAMMIPAQGARPELARRFVDYLLSQRGQRVVQQEAFFFDLNGSVPEGVEAPPGGLASGTLRPIVIGPGLLPTQDRAKRERFLREWRIALEGAEPRALQ
jgi:iron(III) transport system substrate-binding protein